MKYLIILTWLYLLSHVITASYEELPPKNRVIYDLQIVNHSRILPVGYTYGRYRANEDWTRR